MQARVPKKDDFSGEGIRQEIAEKNDSCRKNGKTGYNITMTEQQEKKEEAPAPAPPVHKEILLGTRLLSEVVIELNISRKNIGIYPPGDIRPVPIAFIPGRGEDECVRFNPPCVDHFLHLIRYGVPA